MSRMDREKLLLYAITDRKCIGARDFDKAIEDALRGGAGIIQLREKGMDEDALVAEAIRIRALCDRYHALLIINDNYHAAIRAGADGVHVGIEDAQVAEIRKNAPDGFIIGATAKTVEQAQRAQAEGADYLGVGAVFPSPTKTNAIRITPDDFRTIAQSVQIPAVAIGGINRTNIRQLQNIHAAGAALVSAIFAADDIASETAAIKQICQAVFN